MEKPTNQDPVEWALFNNWVAEGNARRAFIKALADSEALDALDGCPDGCGNDCCLPPVEEDES